MGRRKKEENVVNENVLTNNSLAEQATSEFMSKVCFPYEDQDQWGENTPYYEENDVVSTENNIVMTLKVVESIKPKNAQAIATNLTRQEMRLLIDEYYKTQKRRIGLGNNIRSIEQGYDDTSNTNMHIVKMLYTNAVQEEKNIKKVLEAVVQSSEVGRWLLSATGIGPVLAAGCLAYVEVYDYEHGFLRKPSQIVSYAGLDDQNRPWLGKTKAEAVINEVIGKSRTITDEHLAKIAILTGRSVNTLAENCLAKEKVKDKRGHVKYELKYDKDGNVKRDKKELLKHLSMTPYNKSLKVLMWKIGESFIKNSERPKTLYGRLYQTRKLIETTRNEKGEYAEQAAHILETKNIGKDTDAYKYYSNGQLPPPHIKMRAIRWAEKIFLHHLYEEMCLVAGYIPYAPYITCKIGPDGFVHRGYIHPEVPYSRELKDRPGTWIEPSTINIDTIMSILNDVVSPDEYDFDLIDDACEDEDIINDYLLDYES